MADLPAIRTLEDRLLLYAGDRARIEDEVKLASREVFGIEEADTLFEWPTEYWGYPEDSHESAEMCAAWDKHEEQFESGDDLTDDETMELMARLGLGFSDDRGQPLRCTKHLARVAEAAAKGILGRMPDRAFAKLANWEDALTKERDAFLSKKRKP
jgi:hypothetical protein